jgi:AbrB family looped-hinge helix DNA binding protein
MTTMVRITRVIGPKGQVVIPKELRDATGMVEGTEVVVELRGDGVLIKRPSPSSGSFVEYFIETKGEKPRSRVDIEKVLEGEAIDRIGLR